MKGLAAFLWGAGVSFFVSMTVAFWRDRKRKSTMDAEKSATLKLLKLMYGRGEGFKVGMSHCENRLIWIVFLEHDWKREIKQECEVWNIEQCHEYFLQRKGSKSCRALG